MKKIMLSVLGVVLVGSCVAVAVSDDLRSGLVATFKGTAKDTGTLVSGDVLTEVVVNSVDYEGTEITDSVEDENTQSEDVAGVVEVANLQVHILGTAGTAVLVVDGDKAMLLDGGYASNGNPEYVVNYIKQQGITQLRYAVATNYHPSSIEGFSKILSLIPSDYILLSENLAEDEKGSSIRSYLDSNNLLWSVPNERARFKLNDVEFELIPSHEGGSLITVVTNGTSRMVFSGDISRVDDEVLTLLPRNADLYFISTRTQSYSLPEKALEYMNPKTIVVGSSKSASQEDNMALSDVFDILSDSDVEVHTNSKRGNLVIGSDGENLSFIYPEI